MNSYKILDNISGILSIKVLLVGVVFAVLFSACDEEEFLKTEPVEFYSPENSYVTAGNYEAAVMNLYDRVRTDFFSSDNAFDFPSAGNQATDMFYLHKDIGFNSSMSSLLLPTNDQLIFESLWQPAYRAIYDANVIIGRAATDDNELTEAEKSLFIAEAKFFRGYMYKMLANLHGNVPIVLEETQEPKRDYSTSTRTEVYEQAARDLEDATQDLMDIDDAPDHRINKLAAYHILSEVYISLGRYQDAVDAATMVINNPSTALMTNRFGSRMDEKYLTEQWDTDVYWDLFRAGNQNRSIGNTEAIWVLQDEYNVPGSTSRGGPEYERLYAPRIWQAKVQNNDGTSSTVVPEPNAYTGGRSSGFLRPSYYFFETLWQKSGYNQDIRNSPANITRDFIIRNPDSDYNGQWIFADNTPIAMSSLNDTTRNMYPWIGKTSTPGDQPAEAFVQNPSVFGAVSFSHAAFRDVYAIRLAETYLLRAEAYLGLNQPQNAADDINVVRGRAQAPLIASGDVDIDYILDERARELYLEEFRLLTLTRLNLLVERTRTYNAYNGDTYDDHNNLWPIPFSEIEKNLEGSLTQNPDY